jgi:HB1/ASXL restriction endonuclease-like protein with HTH domain
MSDQPVNPYDGMIAHLRAQRDQIDQAIIILESLRDGIAVSAVVGSANTIVTAHTREGEIAAGTFHGMSIEEATKKLLQSRKRALGVKEITSSLRAGGLHLQSETPENTVASVLGRAFNGGSDIVRVSRGIWGLQEWYPNQRFNRRGED